MRSEILNSHVEWHPEERDSDATLKETSQSTASIFSVVDTRKTRREAVSRFVVNAAYLRYKRVSNDTYVRTTSRRPQDVCVTYLCTDFPRGNRCSSLLWTAIHAVQRFDVEKHSISEFLWESEWEMIFLKNRISLCSITWEIIWKNGG